MAPTFALRFAHSRYFPVPSLSHCSFTLPRDIGCLVIRSGKSGGTDWDLNLVFFKEVDAEADESKWVVGDRNIQFHIIKKNKDEDFWPRLLEDKKLEKRVEDFEYAGEQRADKAHASGAMIRAPP